MTALSHGRESLSSDVGLPVAIALLHRAGWRRGGALPSIPALTLENACSRLPQDIRGGYAVIFTDVSSWLVRPKAHARQYFAVWIELRGQGLISCNLELSVDLGEDRDTARDRGT